MGKFHKEVSIKNETVAFREKELVDNRALEQV
jgi:hypothetical protein